MKALLLVGLGGGIGAMGRHLISRLAVLFPHGNFPLGTFMANVIGGLLMGLLVGWLARRIEGGNDLRLFLGVGMLGGFTTFSSFSLEMVQMIERKAYLMALFYSLASVALAVTAVFSGLMLARKLFPV